ncbi:uncharacterized protein LOC112514852 [Cynara cardunculus var. scolymus]|uniref:DnaJ domain-containing protein n=1 Tax=Cynara cardunculus var. scolymus TaxID=59895 RepID=A0A103XXZ0_CYNCS|nr:uncharacterized protein LOC112514852 [Cynara cardunculus var. scolymus]KVH99008.1 DnaJ domain-containing protein [Cynara cardunculus var. scolymus]
MECNKDEALRAKEISEVKLVEQDFVGAKKLAQKAEKLFSGLEGLPQLLTTLDVYISSEKKINGQTDWYGVLGVEPTADDETIRKNYRKLALTLHPDKNKSAGAEGAFKLVSEAWTLLSDKVKRKIYDQKRNPRPVYQKPVTETQKTSAPTTQPTQPIPRPPNTTFWTKCTRCLMHFEYLKIYLNQKILCPNCRGPFWAVELSAPPINHHATTRYPQKQNHNANHQVNVPQGPSLNSSRVNHVNVQQGPSVNTSAVNGSGQFKRRHEVKAGATRYQTSNSGLGSVKGDGIAKRRRVAEQSSMVHASNAYVKANSGGEKVNVSVQRKLNNSTRELSQAEVRTMLMKKARKEIHKKMDEWIAEKASRKEGRKRENEMTHRGKKNADEITVNGMSKVKGIKAPSKDAVDTVNMDSDTKEVDMGSVAKIEAVLMIVPDPDFHDFDMDRTERSFGENEVWAAYDEDDGMPRYYAMIHSVISKKPFKMRISWLNSKSNAELGPINWVASGFPKTSGDFRIGKHEINTSLNSFSHKVQWTKGKKGVIQIYPRKGQVWALYRNWSPDWNQFTPDVVVHKYDMVVVVEDYNEEKGVMVAPLVKVTGFKSVFHQHPDEMESRTIPREEIFRLSHQVPFYLLTGEESLNIPKGCWELDPAALPLELLQPTIETKVKAVDDGQDSRGNEAKGIITYARKMRKNVELKGKEIDETNKGNQEATDLENNSR